MIYFLDAKKKCLKLLMKSALALVGRVLDLGLKGCQFDTHQMHCVVFLSKTFYPLLSTGVIQEDWKVSQHDCKLVGWDIWVYAIQVI